MPPFGTEVTPFLAFKARPKDFPMLTLCLPGMGIQAFAVVAIAVAEQDGFQVVTIT
jgi:hypothetical protein